jgi:SAM-dependent methyltransferase
MAKARLFQSGVSDDWESDGDEHFQARRYNSYEQYLEHQKLKVGFLNLSDYDQKFREALAERLRTMEFVEHGSRVVCLAARIGSEVKAFKDVGCFAVGIDLNPGEDNQHVLHGDFHDLQFADSSVDFIYSNSLDHAFDIEKIVKEVKRALRPDGIFLVEAIRGSDEGVAPQDFESFFWESIEDLVDLFEKLGLELVGKLPFEQPWKGIQLQLRNVKTESEVSQEEPSHASA